MGTHLQEEEYWQDLDVLSYVINLCYKFATICRVQTLKAKDSNKGTPPHTKNQIEIFRPFARRQVTILAELPDLWKV
jgi:hypothetical protein